MSDARHHTPLSPAEMFSASEADWAAAGRFHGHLGPWLALGLRLGRDLLELLDATGHFGLLVEVECPPAPPLSCLLDGLQWSTGATMGKQNLVARPADQVKVTITRRADGRRAVAAVRQDVAPRFAQWLAALPEAEAARRVWDSPAAELYELLEPGNG